MKCNMLNGKYCKLRPIASKDADVTYQWRSSERATLLNKAAATVFEQKNWIESKLHSVTEHNFIIELNEFPVGMISIVDIDQILKTAETGRFLIGEPEKCQGIPVACDSLICHYDFAFSVLELESLYGNIDPSNRKMINFHKYTGAKVSKTTTPEFGFQNFKEGYINILLDKSQYFNVVRKKLINLMELT